MASETLGTIAEIVMGQSPPGEACNESGEGLPLLNGPTEFGSHDPTPVQFTTDPRKLAEPGDILFCVRGSTTGRMNWADREYAIGRGIAAIRHKKGREFQPFLKALIDYRLPELLAQATGSTFPNVSYGQLAELYCDVPSGDEQRVIAHVLGTLDDKIELNRRMNETLEVMARAIFKSWFVDFLPVREKAAARTQTGDPVRAKVEGRDLGLPKHIADLFPDHFEDSELGEIPKGWGVGSVDDEFGLTMGQSPPGETYNEAGVGLPFYQGCTDFGFRFPTRRIYCTAPTRLGKAGDTLVSVRAPVGDINMATEDCAIGRGVAAVRHKTGSRSYSYQFMQSIEEVFARFEAEGTVFGSIGKKDFHAIACVNPPRELVLAYEARVSLLDDRIEVNERESRTLATLRDTLLPKLISGELRVNHAERFLEGAV